MRITPLDIRKQDFKRVMRGLDPEEVHAFLTTIADEYEAVLLDNKQLRERILELDEKIQEYRHMEKTLRDTLMTAERVLAEARDNARKEADLILKDSEIKAQQATENYRRQSADLRREVVELHKEKEAFLARFKGLAEAQIQFIENHRTDFEDLDRRLMGQATARPQPAQHRAPATEAQPGAPAAPAAGPRQAEERDEWRDYQPRPLSGGSERGATHAASPSPAAGQSPEPRRAEPAPEAPRADSWDDLASPAPRETPRHAEPHQAADLDADDVEELLEPLAAVQEELAAADPEAERRGQARAAEGQPAPGGTARERDATWNMESFTKGLSDL